MTAGTGWAFIAVVAGIISLVLLVFMGLSLIDVAQGEPDLLLEWRVIRLALAASLVFHVCALIALSRRFGGSGRNR